MMQKYSLLGYEPTDDGQTRLIIGVGILRQKVSTWKGSDTRWRNTITGKLADSTTSMRLLDFWRMGEP